MSEWKVRVVRVGEIRKHQDADSLSITEIGGSGGYPVIFRTGQFQEGDKAVYVPVGSLLPADERWDFLRKPGETGPIEIDAKKLRGVFSMGLLAPCDPSWELDQDVSQELGIVRVEPPEPTDGNERDPGLLPVYTDIPALRANPHILVDGEEVVVLEKVHGEGLRAAWGADQNRLYVGSRTNWKDPDGTVPQSKHFWETARRLGFHEKLHSAPGFGIYGEIFGDVRGFHYGASSKQRDFRMFDAMDITRRCYLDWPQVAHLAGELGLKLVPVLYQGPWSNDLRKLAEGNSALAQHVREGFVVRPVKERFDSRIGRVILKLHGEGFLLRGKKGR